MFTIVTTPHPVLAQVAKPVGKIDKSVKELIRQMADTLENATDPEGVGLAAPQVAKSLQIFIVKQAKNAPMLTFINPVMHIPIDAPVLEQKEKNDKKKQKSVKLEGCLSIHEIWGTVKRHPSVVLEYQDENGLKHKKKFTGFLATIIQHEVDHLNGILFPKRVLEQKGKLYKSSKNEKGETVFEEITI